MIGFGKQGPRTGCNEFQLAEWGVFTMAPGMREHDKWLLVPIVKSVSAVEVPGLRGPGGMSHLASMPGVT